MLYRPKNRLKAAHGDIRNKDDDACVVAELGQASEEVMRQAKTAIDYSDENDTAFLHLDKTADGKTSRFFKFVEREDRKR